MTEEENEEVFEYTYSAKEQNFVRKVRESYQQLDRALFSELKTIDQRVKRKAIIKTALTGFIFSLILGIGLSLILVKFLYIIGSLIGSVGIALFFILPRIYKNELEKEKIKNADKINNLSEQILQKK